SGQAQEWKNKYITRDITSNIRAMLDSAPIPTRADKNILAEDFRNYLAQKYDLSYDESKRAISLFQKGKGEEKIPAIANGNKLVSLEDELRNYFEPRNLWEKDMRREPAPDPAKAAARIPAPSQGNMGNPMNGSPVQRSLDAFRQFVEAAKE